MGRILRSLNLKNPRAYILASELAERPGESLTGTVIAALAQRLDAKRRNRSRAKVAENILAFADRFSMGLPQSVNAASHADISGDDGLPR